MQSFYCPSLVMFQATAKRNQAALGDKWAPGFEPGNLKENDGAVFKQVLLYAAAHGVKAMATWEVHEVNVGDQPQWLFDAVNAFLDAP